MAKSNLYTRTGDTGTTSLVGGERVPKSSPRLEAYGTLDEFSATLGIVLTHQQCPPDITAFLQQIQNTLFNLGAYLATQSTPQQPAVLYGLEDTQIAAIEAEIDRLDADTPKIHAFILPGGTPLAAHTHLARTVCRRAERRMLALDAEEPLDPRAIRYINRLSDYLFILGRHFNHLANVPELTWHKS